MAQFLEWVQTPQGYSTIAAIGLFLINLISALIRYGCIKSENNKIQRLIEILPEAMQYAENQGGSAQQKLSIAVDYITKRIKGLSLEIITDAIEKGIVTSKTININSTSGRKEESTKQETVSSDSRRNI